MVFEPFVGGNVYDVGTDGSECRWSRVLAYDPPRGWSSAGTSTREWAIETDPALCSEVEVSFTQEPAGHDHGRARASSPRAPRRRDPSQLEGMRHGLAGGSPRPVRRRGARPGVRLLKVGDRARLRVVDLAARHPISRPAVQQAPPGARRVRTRGGARPGSGAPLRPGSPERWARSRASFGACRSAASPVTAQALDALDTEVRRAGRDRRTAPPETDRMTA